MSDRDRLTRTAFGDIFLSRQTDGHTKTQRKKRRNINKNMDRVTASKSTRQTSRETEKQMAVGEKDTETDKDVQSVRHRYRLTDEPLQRRTDCYRNRLTDRQTNRRTNRETV